MTEKSPNQKEWAFSIEPEFIQKDLIKRLYKRNLLQW